MKIKFILLSLALFSMIFTGCNGTTTGINPPPVATTDMTQPTTTAIITQPTTDANTTASIVNDTISFQQAISKNGTWIIATLNDLSFPGELILEGVFKNGKKDEETGKDIIQRKIALYKQDANRIVTDRFTLTARKLTIMSPNASIQHGTFVGDLYVDAKNFELVDTTVDGNIYFKSTDAKTTFKMDSDSSYTGTQELVE